MPGWAYFVLGFGVAAVLLSVFRRSSETEVRVDAAPSAGAPTLAPDDARLAPVLALLAKNRLIDAIKEYRTLTGAGLKEAKDAVEALRDRQ